MDGAFHALAAGLPAAHLIGLLVLAALGPGADFLATLGSGPGDLAAAFGGIVASPPYQTGQTIICNFYTAIKGIAIPVALIGLLVAFIAFMARPLAPRFYAENAESVKTVLIGVVGIGFAPTIISLVLSIAGGGSNGLGNCP
jgi:hypothetical protein